MNAKKAYVDLGDAAATLGRVEARELVLLLAATLEAKIPPANKVNGDALTVARELGKCSGYAASAVLLRGIVKAAVES